MNNHSQKIGQLRRNGEIPRHKQLKLTQEKIENLKRHIASKKIEFIIKVTSQRKDQAQMSSIMNFIKCLELTAILPKLFQNTEKKEIFPTSFYEGFIILIPKQSYEGKNVQRPISILNTDTKILANRTKQHIKTIIYHDCVEFIIRTKLVNIQKSINIDL